MTTLYKFKAYYTDAGVGTVQDPAPTCTVINMADDSKLADAQATTASTNMPGLYSYEYSGNDGLDCVAWFKTTDTGCDVKQLASYVSEKITTNLNADVAGVETKLDTVDANVDAILADTGTDGVVVASLATDSITAAALKADAVTEIQNGLATAAALDAVDNFVDTEITTIDGIVDAIKLKTDLIPATPAQAGEYTAAIAAIPTTPLLAANYTAPDNASIAAILEDTGTAIPATLAGLATSAEVGAITMLDEVVVGSYTMQDILKILAAKMVGKATGGGTATITYRGVDDTSDVIIETVDANGNRSNMTLTV